MSDCKKEKAEIKKLKAEINKLKGVKPKPKKKIKLIKKAEPKKKEAPKKKELSRVELQNKFLQVGGISAVEKKKREEEIRKKKKAEDSKKEATKSRQSLADRFDKKAKKNERDNKNKEARRKFDEREKAKKEAEKKKKEKQEEALKDIVVLVEDKEQEGRKKVEIKKEYIDMLEEIRDRLGNYRYISEGFMNIDAFGLEPRTAEKAYASANRAIKIPKPLKDLEKLLDEKGKVQEAIMKKVGYNDAFEFLFTDEDIEIRDVDFEYDFLAEREGEGFYALQGYRNKLARLKEDAKESLLNGVKLAKPAIKALKKAIKTAP